jgi:hypothetical protein
MFLFPLAITKYTDTPPQMLLMALEPGYRELGRRGYPVEEGQMAKYRYI